MMGTKFSGSWPFEALRLFSNPSLGVLVRANIPRRVAFANCLTLPTLRCHVPGSHLGSGAPWALPGQRAAGLSQRDSHGSAPGTDLAQAVCLGLSPRCAHLMGSRKESVWALRVV